LEAIEFLKLLQDEHFLYSHPIPSYEGARFPILVIEGKAYSTGTNPFEAENQVAGAGSCMINLLQQLIDVYDQNVPDSGRGTEVPPVFSITIYGPSLHLWLHFRLVENGATSYHMSILKTCYGSVANDLETFLRTVDQLMSWNKGGFLTEVTNRLYGILCAGRRNG
jgi:hypothetical protein